MTLQKGSSGAQSRISITLFSCKQKKTWKSIYIWSQQPVNLILPCLSKDVCSVARSLLCPTGRWHSFCPSIGEQNGQICTQQGRKQNRLVHSWLLSTGIYWYVKIQFKNDMTLFIWCLPQGKCLKVSICRMSSNLPSCFTMINRSIGSSIPFSRRNSVPTIR